MKTVLIIEFMDFHAELFPMYQDVLSKLLAVAKDELRLIYCVSPRRFHSMPPSVDGEVICIEPAWRRWLVSKVGLRKNYYAKMVQKLIKQFNPDAMVFNTVEARAERFLPAVEAASSIPTFLIAHHPDEPVFQKLAKQQNRKVLCLNQYNFDYWQHKGVAVDGWVTPKHPVMEAQSKRKQDGKIHIIIPGEIDNRRRDYHHLIEILKACKARDLKQLKWIVVAANNSKYAQQLMGPIEQFGVQDWVAVCDHRPSDVEFAQAFIDCDLVMPLMGDHYKNGVMSGSVVHAQAYRKPMILKSDMAKHMGLADHAVVAYQSVDELLNLLTSVDVAAVTKNYATAVADMY